jgi:hypothetical protein
MKSVKIVIVSLNEGSWNEHLFTEERRMTKKYFLLTLLIELVIIYFSGIYSILSAGGNARFD